MLTAQCNGFRIMTPATFRLVPYKLCCHYAVLPAAGELNLISFILIIYSTMPPAFTSPLKTTLMKKVTLCPVAGSCNSVENRK